jgi:hypothetical protein
MGEMAVELRVLARPRVPRRELEAELELRARPIPDRRFRREKRVACLCSRTGGANVDVEARVLGGSLKVFSSSTLDASEDEIETGRSLDRICELDRGRGDMVSFASAPEASKKPCSECMICMLGTSRSASLDEYICVLSDGSCAESIFSGDPGVSSFNGLSIVAIVGLEPLAYLSSLTSGPGRSSGESRSAIIASSASI